MEVPYLCRQVSRILLHQPPIRLQPPPKLSVVVVAARRPTRRRSSSSCRALLLLGGRAGGTRGWASKRALGCC